MTVTQALLTKNENQTEIKHNIKSGKHRLQYILFKIGMRNLYGITFYLSAQYPGNTCSRSRSFTIEEEIGL